MKTGTKSVLFGIHNPIIHSLFMCIAWIKIHGWSWELLDPRLHFCFLLHDIGYWGCESMDGPDGELHPIRGSEWVRRLFGDQWGNLCRWHSGTMVEKDIVWYGSIMDAHPSRLYAVDKLASPLYPTWLYKLLSGWSGEWKEYAEIHYGGTLTKDHGMHAITLAIEKETEHGTIIHYRPTYFREWHHHAMRRMRKRAYQYVADQGWTTMAKAVKEKWDD